MGTADGREGVNPLKVAGTAFALVVAIATGVIGATEYFAKKETFVAFTQQYYTDRLEDQYDRVTERIWATEDQLKKRPHNEDLEKRLRELYYEKSRIEERLEKRGNQ